jgi:1,4-beta-D-xylan synthase
MWLWWISIVGDFWFGLTWLLNQITKFKPRKCVPKLSKLSEQFDLSDGISNLPIVDVFITNSVLSILATDYPAEKYATYFSDDGGSLIHYEGLLETAKFAALWVPFCRKHCVEPRAPENYFGRNVRPYTGSTPNEFIDDHRRMRVEYEELKARLDVLSAAIAKRSETFNSANTKEGRVNATWMSDGTQWPGTWIEETKGHMKENHPAIFKVNNIIGFSSVKFLRK